MTFGQLRPAKDLLFRFPDERRFWQVMREHCASRLRHDPSGRAYETQEAWSFEDWEDLLNAAVEYGVAAVIVDDSTKPEAEQKIRSFAGPFGFALLERWRWLQESRRRGLTPQEAEDLFTKRVDAAHLADREQRERERLSSIQRRKSESRRSKVKVVEDDEL